MAKNTGMAQIKALDWWRWLISGQDIILGVGTVLILYVSINQFISGEVTLGTLTFIYTAYVGLIGQLYNFSQGIRDITSDMADMQDLFEYQNVEIKIKDLPNAKPINIEKGKLNSKMFLLGLKKNAYSRISI